MSDLLSIYLKFNEKGISLLANMVLSNNDELVCQLLEKYPNYLEDAIFAYALVGNDNKIEEFLDPQNPKHVKAAITGYARGNHFETANALVAENALLAENEEYKKALVYGHAQAGNETQIRAALNAQAGIKYLKTIIEGLAFTDQYPLLIELLAGTCFYPDAIEAAASSGNTYIVKKLLLEAFGIDLENYTPERTPEGQLTRDAILKKNLLNRALKGYCDGRHFRQVAKLIACGANPYHCISSLSSDTVLNETQVLLLLSHIKNNEIRESAFQILARCTTTDMDAEGLERIDQLSKIINGDDGGQCNFIDALKILDGAEEEVIQEECSPTVTLEVLTNYFFKTENNNGLNLALYAN